MFYRRLGWAFWSSNYRTRGVYAVDEGGVTFNKFAQSLIFDIVHHGLRAIPRRSLHPAVKMAAKGVVPGEYCMRVDETIHYNTVFIRLNAAALIIFFTFSMRAFISESLFLNH